MSQRAEGSAHDEATAEAHLRFLDHPIVHAYVSQRAFGGLSGRLEAVVGEIRSRTAPGARILAPRCGDTVAEMTLAAALPDRLFECRDPFPARVEAARREVERRGIGNLRIEVAEVPELAVDEDAFDVITALGFAHHTERLEELWAVCRAALRPNGVILAQEYVGPSGLGWSEAQREAANRVLDEVVPDEHKTHHTEVGEEVVQQLRAGAPWLAARSGDLVATCEQAGFEFTGFARAGCALLHPVLVAQIETFDPASWEHNYVLATLFREEAALMEQGLLGDDFAMFVARAR